jgi:hypothetical protein
MIRQSMQSVSRVLGTMFPLLLLAGMVCAAEHKFVKLTDHRATIRRCAFSRDGQWIALGDGSGDIHVSNTKTGELKFTLTHGRNLQGIVFSPDGKRFWTCADDDPNGKPGNVRLWDAGNGKLIKRFNAGYYGKCLVFSQDDKSLLAYGETGGTIHAIDRAGNVREVMKKGLVVSSDASLMYFFRRIEQELEWRLMAELDKPTTTMKFGTSTDPLCCPAAGKFIFANRDAAAGPLSPMFLTIFDVKTKQESEPIKVGFKSLGLAGASPDARYVVFSTRLPRTNHSKLCLWDFVQNKEVAEIAGAELPQWRLAIFSPDRQHLAILDHGSRDRPAGARIWDLTEIVPPLDKQKPDQVAAAKPKPNPFRTWTSANKKFKIRARLLRANETDAVLVKEDGKEITVPLSKLSATDRAYARRAANQ